MLLKYYFRYHVKNELERKRIRSREASKTIAGIPGKR